MLPLMVLLVVVIMMMAMTMIIVTSIFLPYEAVGTGNLAATFIR